MIDKLNDNYFTEKNNDFDDEFIEKENNLNENSDEKELILVVEDSEYLNDYISKNLRKNNYEVIQCLSEKKAYKLLAKNFFSLVILDLNLGDESKTGGMNILHSIRLQDKMLPVMIVSSIQDDKTKLKGFREGCDDFLTKPFFINELIARVDRMIERFSFMGMKKKMISTEYSSGIFQIDVEKGLVYKNKVPLSMRKKQFDLMLYFIQNPNVILSFQSIYLNVWKESLPDEKTLESNIYVNIRSLRSLIEEDKKNPKHIVSVSKSGYIFVPE